MEAFKDRIRKRAIEKLKEQIEETKKEEEIERQARLGPGGLDPVEVFESLPDVSPFDGFLSYFFLQLIFDNSYYYYFFDLANLYLRRSYNSYLVVIFVVTFCTL